MLAVIKLIDSVDYSLDHYVYPVISNVADYLTLQLAANRFPTETQFLLGCISSPKYIPFTSHSDSGRWDKMKFHILEQQKYPSGTLDVVVKGTYDPSTNNNGRGDLGIHYPSNQFNNHGTHTTWFHSGYTGPFFKTHAVAETVGINKFPVEYHVTSAEEAFAASCEDSSMMLFQINRHGQLEINKNAMKAAYEKFLQEIQMLPRHGVEDLAYREYSIKIFDIVEGVVLQEYRKWPRPALK